MISQRKLWKLSQVIDAIRCPNTSCNARYHKCCAKRECSKCKKEFIRIPAANHSDDNEEDEVWNWVNYWFKLPKWFFSAYHMSHMILVLKILQYTASIQKIEIDAGFFLAKSFWLKVVDDFIEKSSTLYRLFRKCGATKMLLFLPPNWRYSDFSSEIIDD